MRQLLFPFSQGKFFGKSNSYELLPADTNNGETVCTISVKGIVISSSDALFSFCPQSFPESGNFPMSHLFAAGDQNAGISASSSVLPVIIQDWSSLRLTGLVSLLSKGLSGVFFSSTVQRHQFLGTLLSLQSSSHNHTWPLGRPLPWLFGSLWAE